MNNKTTTHTLPAYFEGHPIGWEIFSQKPEFGFACSVMPFHDDGWRVQGFGTSAYEALDDLDKSLKRAREMKQKKEAYYTAANAVPQKE